MNEKQLRTVVGNLRRVIGPGPASRVSDAQLVERFLSRRDELAFEMLVWRHGSMVLNLCRRVLRDAHEAEDAFQATFLLFVRKLGSIGKREAVGSWLYKVAYRVALRARQRATVRRTAALPDAEQLAGGPALDDPAQRALWNDLRPVLDEEVNRLPEKYRTPFVLFYLEGMAYPEVAEELGCPKGTVSSRLTAAKGMLRKRLLRRGVALSTALLGGVLAKAASAAVSVGLTNSTMQTVRLIAGGPAASAGAVSARAVALAEGVLKTMLMTKIKLAAALVLAVGVLGFGTTLVVQHAVQAQDPAPKNSPSLKPPLVDPGAPADVPNPPPTPSGGVRLQLPAPAPHAPVPPGDLLLPPDAAPPDPFTPTPAYQPAQTPAPKDDTLANRLARIEQRLARLEAEMARMQAKPGQPKPDHPYGGYQPTPDARPAPEKLKPDSPYGSGPTPYTRPAPEKLPPDPRKPVDPSSGPRPDNPFGIPRSTPPPAGDAVNAENVPVINAANFKLPVAIEPDSRGKIARIALFVSDDQGATWKKAAVVGPDQDSVPFSAPHDGVYWFKVQVLHTDKSRYPAELEANKTVPDLKVQVHTKPAGQDKEALLKDLESQLKSIQKRITELQKTKEGDYVPSPAKP